MRTRFLNTDYFAVSSSPIATLGFLNLPAPQLPYSVSLSNAEQVLTHFGPLATICHEIERFPIDTALSKFITQVVPQNVDVDYQVFEESQSLYDLSFADEHRTSSQCHEEYNETMLDEIHEKFVDFIQFEEPDVSFLSGNICDPSVKSMDIFEEFLEAKNNLDLKTPELRLQYEDETQESIYAVQDVTLNYDFDQEAHTWEDSSHVPEKVQLADDSFPILEVAEIGFEASRKPFVEDKFLSFIEKNGSQWTENFHLTTDEMELLHATQCDTLEFLFNHCLSKYCFDSEITSANAFSCVDIITLVETVQGTDSSCYLPKDPLVFEEFKFLDVELSRYFEMFFETQIANELDICSWMLAKDIPFKDFNELIVGSELNLEDDTFKSMPHPIVSDNDKLWSIYVIAGEILAELTMLPLSASDGIYLDWHLLEKDNYNDKMLHSVQNMVEKLDFYNIDNENDSLDDRVSVFDILFTDDALKSPRREQYEELLDMPSEATFNNQILEVTTSKSLDNRFQKLVTGEKLSKENSRNAQLSIKSMPEINGPGFPINLGKAASGEINESSVKFSSSIETSYKEEDNQAMGVLDETLDDKSLEEILSSVPTKDNNGMSSSDYAAEVKSHIKPHATSPDSLNCRHNQVNVAIHPEIVIIVNTKNFEKETIVSRRSTYPTVLAMEKGGVQVVERDMDLPVDIMISSSMCLVLYDYTNIGKKTSSVDSSCLQACIDSIATDVLTLLSFSFSGCILMFEGEVSFLSMVMESSDVLYAAAASLGIDLQLFCSHSSELTNCIISSSILSATKLGRGLFPKMPDSETLAESFLTKFLSVNPLTAHAILSSGNILIEFLRLSQEHKILAVEKYRVPHENVVLFNALCKYGEKEDSKSIMTDCSSSASSCPDSDKSRHSFGSERKQSKSADGSRKVSGDMEDIWQLETLKQFSNGSEAFEPNDSWAPTNRKVVNELKRSSSYSKDLFGQMQVMDDHQMINCFTVSNPHDLQCYNDPLTTEKFTRPKVSLNDTFSVKNYGSEINHSNKLDLMRAMKSNSHEDFVGEVIDLTEYVDEVPSITFPTSPSPWLSGIEQVAGRKAKAARRLPFSNSNHPILPSSGTACTPDPDIWNFSADFGQTIPERNNNPHADGNTDVFPKRHTVELSEDFKKRAVGNSKNSSFTDEMSHLCATPLSKAVYSSTPQHGSPWTIEFLNRVRERSRLRQQSLPRDASSPVLGYSDSQSKIKKKRSPSILEFFKYQGGRTPGRMQPQNKLRESVKLPSSSKNKKPLASFDRILTPLDKKSRKTLSFEMAGNGSQTKLVWSDEIPQSKKFRHI